MQGACFSLQLQLSSNPFPYNRIFQPHHAIHPSVLSFMLVLFCVIPSLRSYCPASKHWPNPCLPIGRPHPWCGDHPSQCGPGNGPACAPSIRLHPCRGRSLGFLPLDHLTNTVLTCAKASVTATWITSSEKPKPYRLQDGLSPEDHIAKDFRKWVQDVNPALTAL